MNYSGWGPVPAPLHYVATIAILQWLIVHDTTSSTGYLFKTFESTYPYLTHLTQVWEHQIKEVAAGSQCGLAGLEIAIGYD